MNEQTPLHEQVRRLEADGSLARALLDDLRKRHKLQSEQVRTLEDDLRVARAIRDELSEHNKSQFEQVRELSRTLDAYQRESKDPRLPRVVTSDELKIGQLVIEFHNDDSHVYGRIKSIEGALTTRMPNGWTTVLLDDGGRTRTATIGGVPGTLVLLEDAPETTYADDDHDDAEVTQWHGPAPTTGHSQRKIGGKVCVDDIQIARARSTNVVIEYTITEAVKSVFREAEKNGVDIDPASFALRVERSPFNTYDVLTEALTT